MSFLEPRRALHWILGGLIAFAGVLSEICDAAGRTRGDLGLNTHLLFGVMLCLGVIYRYRYGSQASEVTCRGEVVTLTRQMTRSVYLLLYALLAVKLLLPSFGGVHTSPESFQPYLASGVAAILLTRGLSLLPTKGRGPRRITNFSLFLPGARLRIRRF